MPGVTSQESTAGPTARHNGHRTEMLPSSSGSLPSRAAKSDRQSRWKMCPHRNFDAESPAARLDAQIEHTTSVMFMVAQAGDEPAEPAEPAEAAEAARTTGVKLALQRAPGARLLHWVRPYVLHPRKSKPAYPLRNSEGERHTL